MPSPPRDHADDLGEPRQALLGARQDVQCVFLLTSKNVPNLFTFASILPLFELADAEFDELCFEFGIELDEVVLSLFFPLLFAAALLIASCLSYFQFCRRRRRR